jgi:DegV family protein with EDD domain
MAKVAIVTDSTATIPPELTRPYTIRVAPQVLVWGKEMFNDGVDIQPEEFYNRLKTAKIMPTTSQVSPKAFKDIYTDLLDQGFEILSVLISEKLSGTIISAIQAQEMFPGAPIEIVDSHTTAMAMGFQVLLAARAAAQGASLADCKALVEEARQHSGVVFAVDTLEFLHRGGRIGGASRLLGTALNIKPILEIVNGQVEAVDRVRTRKKSLSRVLEIVQERIGSQRPVHIATLHANAPEEAKLLLSLANEQFNAIESVSSEVSPVVGTHAGPGTAGLAYLAGI